MYDNLHTEVELIRETVQKWMIHAGRRINDERISTKPSPKTKSSKASHASSTSSRASRALQANARQAELEARIAQLDNVEAAKKEADRGRVRVDFAAVVAICKVYEAKMRLKRMRSSIWALMTLVMTQSATIDLHRMNYAHRKHLSRKGTAVSEHMTNY